jgi:hypothetical protein
LNGFERQAVGLLIPPSFPDRDFAFNLFIGKKAADFRTFFVWKDQLAVLIDIVMMRLRTGSGFGASIPHAGFWFLDSGAPYLNGEKIVRL